MAGEDGQVELELVKNVIRSFDWRIAASSLAGDVVRVECEKDVKGKTEGMKAFEVQRLQGIVKYTGWALVASRFADETAFATFEKTVKGID